MDSGLRRMTGVGGVGMTGVGGRVLGGGWVVRWFGPWIAAYAGMTGWWRGSDGDGGAVRSFDFVAGQHNPALGRLEAVLTRHFAQDERRGRRIGGSWG